MRPSVTQWLFADAPGRSLLHPRPRSRGGRRPGRRDAPAHFCCRSVRVAVHAVPSALPDVPIRWSSRMSRRDAVLRLTVFQVPGGALCPLGIVSRSLAASGGGLKHKGWRGEFTPDKGEVRGSSPRGPTIFSNGFRRSLTGRRPSFSLATTAASSCARAAAWAYVEIVKDGDRCPMRSPPGTVTFLFHQH